MTLNLFLPLFVFALSAFGLGLLLRALINDIIDFAMWLDCLRIRRSKRF